MSSNQDLFRLAMGNRPGDELVLRNQWATVTIYRCWGNRERFKVIGDLKKPDSFPSMDAALVHATEALAEFAKGRAD